MIRIKNNARRLVVILLTVCLLPVIRIGLAENASKKSELFGSQLVDADDSIRSVALVKDTIYILTRRAFYIANTDERNARFVCEATELYDARPGMPPAVGMLFEKSGELLGFNQISGKMYSLAFEKDTVVFSEKLTLDMTPFLTGDPPNEYIQEAERGILLRDRLYLKMPTFQHTENDLFCFDLATKELTALGLTCLQGAVPYKEGKLIGLRYASSQTQNSRDGCHPPVIELAEFDPETQEVTALPYELPRTGVYPTSPLLYDVANDAVYVAADTQLLRFNPKPEVVGILPGSAYSSMKTAEMTWFQDGLLIAAETYAFFRTPENNLSAVELRVYGGQLDRRAASRALMSMDHVSITLVEPSEKPAADLVALLVTKALDADILLLSSDRHDIQMIAKQGYLRELSGNPDIKTYAGTVNAMFDPLIYQGQRLFGVPIHLSFSSLTANRKILEKLGGTVPASFCELLELIAQWNDEWYDLNTGFSLIEQPRIKSLLKALALDWYADTKIANAASPLFMAEEMTRFFTLVDELDVSAFDVDAPGVDETDMAFLLEGSTPILEPSMVYTLKNAAEGGFLFTPVIVSPLPEYQGKTRGAATMMSVYALSSKAEIAEQFMSLYIQNMDQLDQAMLSANTLEPIRNPYYEQSLADRKKYLDQLKAQLAVTDGMERRGIEADLAYLTERYEEAAENEKYLVTGRQLQQNEKILQAVYLDNSLTLTQNRLITENQALRDMLFSGTIDVKQYADQMNAKLELAELESR